MADDDLGLMTVSEIARLMGVHVRSVRTLIESGELPAIRVGDRHHGERQTGMLRITRASYREFLARRTLTAKP